MCNLPIPSFERPFLDKCYLCDTDLLAKSHNRYAHVICRLIQLDLRSRFGKDKDKRLKHWYGRLLPQEKSEFYREASNLDLRK